MDLRQLTTFRMVAATLSFTQAAEALGYVQSSITAQIQALEGELGVTLFERLGRKVALTDAGRQFLEYTEQMLTLADEARAALRGTQEPSGSLTISGPETLCTYRIPAILRRFKDRYPGIRLSFHPYSNLEIRRKIADGGLDLAFILEQPYRSSAFMVDPIVREPLALVASPEHGLVRVECVEPSLLADESFLFTELGCSYRSLFEQHLNEAGVFPVTTLSFNSLEAIKQCVMLGMGLTVLPVVAVEQELAQGKLVALNWSASPMEVVTQIIWHKDKSISPAVQAFLDVAHEMFPQMAFESVSMVKI